MKDLDKLFQEERRVGIDEAMARLEDEHNLEMEKLRKAHGEELKKLEAEDGVSPEDFQHRKAQMLNAQQLQLSFLERKYNEQLKRIKTSATADWEVRYARAKLELKEKHYQVMFNVRCYMVQVLSSNNESILKLICFLGICRCVK